MQVGDTAPDVALLDEDGNRRTLSELAGGRRLVLFFYPAAMTPGCTKEACHFRDVREQFDEAGAAIVGISMDAVDRQARFAATHSLGYPLLSDPGGEVARTFGVKRALGLLKVKRTTFVLDEQRNVLDVVASELRMDEHADRALEVLRLTPRGGAAA